MVNATVNAIHKLKAKMHCKVETVVDAGLQCWTRICLCFDEKNSREDQSHAGGGKRNGAVMGDFNIRLPHHPPYVGNLGHEWGTGQYLERHIVD